MIIELSMSDFYPNITRNKDLIDYVFRDKNITE